MRMGVSLLIAANLVAACLLIAELVFSQTVYFFVLWAALLMLLIRPLERYLSASTYRSISVAARKTLVVGSWLIAAPWVCALATFCIIWGFALQWTEMSELKFVAAISAALPLGAMMMSFSFVPTATTLLTWKPLRSTHVLFGTIHLLRYLTVSVLGVFVAVAVLPWSTGEAPQFAIVSAIILATAGFMVTFQRHAAEQIQRLNTALSKVFVASVNAELVGQESSQKGVLLEAVVELCDLFRPRSSGITAVPTQWVAADGPVQMVWECAAEKLSGKSFGRIAHHARDVLAPAFDEFDADDLSAALADYAIHLKRQLPPRSQQSIAVARDTWLQPQS
ncbi:hypothetical protein [Arthrobacter sp. PAMC 25486]|uniref:hypothetical protein n=1 Tax=Arthrobacter sp. PAMC 25486 TaxID=1494608 RepID=UPI0012FF264B|nr:hypothetical protein [Arthrobacter sp. PAMC 25486]